MKTLAFNTALAVTLRGGLDDVPHQTNTKTISKKNKKQVPLQLHGTDLLQRRKTARRKPGHHEYDEMSKYGGQIFQDSIWNTNLWYSTPYLPLMDDLEPTAPMDRLDSGPLPALVGAPMAPGGESGNKPNAGLYGDFVPPYLHPHTFPYEKEGACVDTTSKKLEDRNLVFKSDRLRPYWIHNHNPFHNYPNVAPEDRLRRGFMGMKTDPIPVAAHDRVPANFAKYFEQIYNNEQKRQTMKRTYDMYKKADTNEDKSISWEEFTAEVEGRQQKSKEETRRLWNRYKMPESQAMGPLEYKEIVRDGFDLGVISRKASLMLKVSCGLDFGFWAGSVMCPPTMKASGARLKTMPLTDGDADNTALNGVQLQCKDKDGKTEEIAVKVDGPDGEYSDWGTCPDGTFIRGFSSRTQFFKPAGDNAGITDFSFICANDAGKKKTKIRFGGDKLKAEEKKYIDNGKMIVAKGAQVNIGGWSTNAMCHGKDFMCGYQPRIEIGQEKGMNMGITDTRFFCCSDKKKKK